MLNRRHLGLLAAALSVAAWVGVANADITATVIEPGDTVVASGTQTLTGHMTWIANDDVPDFQLDHVVTLNLFTGSFLGGPPLSFRVSSTDPLRGRRWPDPA